MAAFLRPFATPALLPIRDALRFGAASFDLL
jgi:hypothetical protein